MKAFQEDCMAISNYIFILICVLLGALVIGFGRKEVPDFWCLDANGKKLERLTKDFVMEENIPFCGEGESLTYLPIRKIIWKVEKKEI